MPPVVVSADFPVEPATRGAANRGRARMPTVLALLFLGLQFNAEIGNVSFGFWPDYLLPLFAAWWARRDGVAVALPLALLSVVPAVGSRIGFVSLGFGYSEVACLLAAGVAIVSAPVDAAKHFAPIARPSWRVVWLTVLFIWACAAAEDARQSVSGDGLTLTIDPLAVPGVLLALLAIDSRRLVVGLGRPSHAAVAGLGALVLIGLAAKVSLRLDDLWWSDAVWLRLGFASASALAPAAVFVAVMCGWTSWWRALLLFAVVALLEQLVAATVGSFSDWALGLSSRPMPWNLLAQSAVAAMLGVAFAHERGARAVAVRPPLHPAVAVSLALAGVLAVLPILSLGLVQVWGTSLWALAGVAFLGGRHLGGSGALGVPLALLGATIAVAVAAGPELNRNALLSDLPSLAGVMLAYGLAGWLARRRNEAAASGALGAGAPESIDISALALVVQQVDRAATVRAFVALLVPVIVLWQAVGVGIAIDFGSHAFTDVDASTWLSIGSIAALFALWPLAFVVVDWMDRQDRFRMLSAITGGALAWLGAAVFALGLGALLSLLLENAPALASAACAALFAVGVLALALWLLGRGTAARRAAQALGAVFALAALAVVLMALAVVLREAQRTPPPWLELVAALAAGVLLAVWCVHAVRLRLVLAEDHPRALIYGALPHGKFWVRMGALLGLPSSMWSRAAFHQPAAWCFLLARPVVYAGAAVLRYSAPLGALAIVVGHGLFALGKRRAAKLPWCRQAEADDAHAPVLFLRSFEDDQFDFQRPLWQLRLRWFDLWSFRRNVDEAMVDEVAVYGPVVALGRPGEAQAPFGAQRHYASHGEWQDVVVRTARRARAIVLVAGESPGLRWEFDLLRREQLLGRTVLLLHPDPARAASNRRALAWLLGDEAHVDRLLASCTGVPLALWQAADGPHLLHVREPSAAAYVVALRAHFQHIAPQALVSALDPQISVSAR